MTSRTLCLLGAGEHAFVVREAAHLSGWSVVGCFAPEASEGMLHLGTDEDCLRTLDRWMEGFFHVAVGGLPGAELRRTLIEHWQDHLLAWATVIHPTAFVSATANIGDGAFVGPRATIHCRARLGPHALVNSGAIVEHGVEAGEGVNFGPGAVIGGGASIGAWAYLGLGCRVRDHVRIGEGAVVGMGAVVVSDVPPGAMVMGVPARKRGI